MKPLLTSAWVTAPVVSAAARPRQAADQWKGPGVFRSDMVWQRDKSLKIWGWAPVGTDARVAFGTLSASDYRRQGRGDLDARPAAR